MSILSGLEQDFRGKTGALRQSWHETRAGWRDRAAAKFEREFWSEWEDLVPRMIRAIQELDTVMSQAVQRTE